jgi:FixJ family two-component response regulator
MNMNVTNSPIVIVVNTDAAVRHALEFLIAASGCRARCFACAADFLQSPREMTPGCLILDVTLPDLCGLELQRRIANRPELPVIFLASQGDVCTTVRAMKAGALEFLVQPVREEIVVDAIKAAIEHSRDAMNRELELQLLRSRHASLTPRERQVLGCVVRGLLNKVIGADLGISEITVKAHRGRVMRKMKVRSLAELVTVAAILGVVALPASTPVLPRATFDAGVRPEVDEGHFAFQIGGA